MGVWNQLKKAKMIVKGKIDGINDKRKKFLAKTEKINFKLDDNDTKKFQNFKNKISKECDALSALYSEYENKSKSKSAPLFKIVIKTGNFLKRSNK